MASATSLLSAHPDHATSAATAAKRQRTRASSRSLWASMGQALGFGSTCDRCGSAMLDFSERCRERICVGCLEAENAALSRPTTSAELVGCAAAMRALLQELHCAATAGTGPRNTAQISSLVETSLTLAWWMTPANLRDASAQRVNKSAVIHLLAAYEATWGRMIGKLSIAGTFQFWMQRQTKALQQSEHAAIFRH